MERETLALAICLVDTNIPPQPSDKQLIDFFKQTQRPFLVVGTKADRLSNNVLAKSIAALKREHGVDEVRHRLFATDVRDRRAYRLSRFRGDDFFFTALADALGAAVFG